MTVETTTSRVSYTGAGTTGPFTIGFYFIENDDIRAIKVLIADGTETELVLDTDFTLTGAGDADGGEATLTDALTSSYNVVFFRDPEVLQEAAYPKNDPFPSATHERVVDRLTMIAQRQASLLDRSLRQPDGDTADIGALPAKLERASTVLGFDADGEPATYNPASAVTDAANVTTTASGTGAVSTDLQTVLRALAVTPQQFGASGDGATDDTAAFTKIAAAAKRYVYLPPGSTFKVTSGTVFSSPVHIFGSGKIKPQLGTAGGKVFSFPTNDVIVENIEFDATGLSATLVANTYAIFGGDGNTKYTNHVYRNIKFTELNFSDGLSALSNLLVTHALYVDNVDDVVIEKNKIHTVSGAGVFTRDVVGLKIANNHLTDCGWYPIHSDNGVDGAEIVGNRITEDLATGCYWGGGIDLQSQVVGTRNKNIRISNNTLTGKYSYGAVMYVSSADNVVIEANTLDGVDAGSLAASDDISGIRITTEGTSTANESGPSQNITILNNTLIASGSGTTDGHRAIYVSNDFQATTDLMEGISVVGNRIISPDSSNYWSEGVIFHGKSGGIREVSIADNFVEVLKVTSPVVDGAVGLVATDVGGKVSRVNIGGNFIRDIGTPASSFQIGIGIGAFVDEVVIAKPNTIDNFFVGARTFTSSGPTIIGLENNFMLGTTTRTSLAIAPLEGAVARNTKLKVSLFDDFLGDLIVDEWGSAVGSDPQVVAPAISVAARGMLRMTTGDDAAASMAVNGVQLHSALNWQANQNGLVAEFRLKLSAITNVSVFIGLTDQVAALEIPIQSAASSDTLTANADNAVGVMFDTAMSTDNWWLVGVAATVKATAQNSAVAPVAATYETWRIELSSAGVATFYRNGAAIGTAMSGAVTATTPLTPVVAAFSLAAASRNIDADYILVEAIR